MKRGISTATAVIVLIVVVIAAVAGTYLALGSRSNSTVTSVITTGSGGGVTTVTQGGTTITQGGSTITQGGSTVTLGGTTVTQTVAGSNKYIKIGFITSLSGVATALGQQMIQGAEYAVQQINNAGGVCYANQCKNVSLIVVDNGDTTDVAVSSVNALIAENVSAVIGFVYTGDVYATQNALLSHKIITIMTSASYNGLLTQLSGANYSTYKYLYRVGPNDSELGYDAFAFMQLANATGYVSINEDFQYTHDVNAYLQNYTAAAGIKNLDTEYTPYSATDYSAQITKIDSLHPTAVIGTFSGSNGFAFLKQYKADPIASKIPIYFAGGPWGSSATISSLNAAQPGSADYIADGTLGWNISLTNLSGPFCQTMISTYGACNVGTQGVNYDAVYSYVKGIEAAHSANPDAVVSAMQNLTFAGASGNIAFTSLHQDRLDPGFAPLPIIEWIKGQAYVIWPSTYAQSKYVPPP